MDCSDSLEGLWCPGPREQRWERSQVRRGSRRGPRSSAWHSLLGGKFALALPAQPRLSALPCVRWTSPRLVRNRSTCSTAVIVVPRTVAKTEQTNEQQQPSVRAVVTCRFFLKPTFLSRALAWALTPQCGSNADWVMWLHRLGGNAIVYPLEGVSEHSPMKISGGANSRYSRSHKIYISILEFFTCVACCRWRRMARHSRFIDQPITLIASCCWRRQWLLPSSYTFVSQAKG